MLSSYKAEVIIVAPENYSTSARRLVHEISSRNSHINAAYWTPSHYEDNEHKTMGDRPVIFIGNTDENKFTESYIEFINDLKENDGTVYGYDGSRAVIFGKGEPDQNINFKDLRGFGKFYVVGTTSVSASSVATLALGPAVVVGGYAAYQYYTNVKKDRKRRASQVERGVDLFLDEALEEWLEIETNGNK